MLNQNIILLVNDDVRLVKVCYEPESASYVYKTLDQSIAVDDYVVIPTDSRHHMTVARVTAVDAQDDFDLEGNIGLKWIIDKVNYPAHKQILEPDNGFDEPQTY